MKRITAMVLIFVLLLGAAIPVRAEKEFNDQFYRVDDYLQAVYDAYEFHYNVPYSSWVTYYECENRFAYVVSDYVFDGHTGLAKFYLELANSILDDADLLDTGRTNTDVKVQYYEVALFSLIKTLEQNLFDSEVQTSADATMKPIDYLVEAAGAAAFLSGLPEGEGVIKGLQGLIGAVEGSMSIVAHAKNCCDSDEDRALLAKLWATYDTIEQLLAAIADYPNSEDSETMGYLKQAAQNIRASMKYSALINLSRFETYLAKPTEELGSFVFSDLLEAVSTQELRSIDSAMDAADWESFFLLSKAVSFFNDISDAVNLGIFVSDCLVGASDIVLRYHEIRAMAAARKAVLYQAQLLHANINGIEDTAMIQELGKYLHCLLYINARGEYCVYSLQKKDSHLLTLTVDGASREKWYSTAMAALVDQYNNVSMLFPNTRLYLRDLDEELSTVGLTSYEAVLDNICDRIGYAEFTPEEKELCLGQFFELNGDHALVVMYRVQNHPVMEAGYHAEVWGRKADAGICRLAAVSLDDSAAESAYVSTAVRLKDDVPYLHTYVQNTRSNLDISDGCYFRIGDSMELALRLYSESPFYHQDGMIRHDESNTIYRIDGQTADPDRFYATQDEWNVGTGLAFVTPAGAEGTEGDSFAELRNQAKNLKPKGTRVDTVSPDDGSLSGAYKRVLLSHPESTSTELFYNGETHTFTNETAYSLYDIDKNGTPELFVREDSSMYYVYAFDGKQAVLCTSGRWTYSNCLYAYDGNGFLLHDGGGGSLHAEYLLRIALEGTEAVTAETLLDTETNSYQDIEAYLSTCTPISDFRPITDDSHLAAYAGS